MILNADASGPRYSTDATANEISRFCGARHTLQASMPREDATGAPGELEELYPSLFAAPQRNVLALAFASVTSALVDTVARLARARADRNVNRISQSASAIGRRYAP